MTTPSEERPASFRRLDGIKRRIYVIALSIAGFGAMLDYTLTDPAVRPRWERVTFGPGVVALTAVFAVVLGIRRLDIRAIERVSFGAVAVVLMLRVAVTFLVATPDAPITALLSEFSPWMAAVFIFAFVALPTRTALPAAIVVDVALASIALLFVGHRGLGSLDSIDRNALIQEFGIANAFTITMLYFLSRTKEELARERTERLLLSRLAHTDDLTGIPNRRFILQQLQRAFDRNKRDPSLISVVLFDLDRFKNVNDTYGHAAGDDVLRRAATLAREKLRSGDEIGRYGGEEFLVVAFGADCAAATGLAERLRSAFEGDQRPDSPKFTATFGVAEARSGETLAQLLSRADTALYAGKARGRNRVVTERDLPAED